MIMDIIDINSPDDQFPGYSNNLRNIVGDDHFQTVYDLLERHRFSLTIDPKYRKWAIDSYQHFKKIRDIQNGCEIEIKIFNGKKGSKDSIISKANSADQMLLQEILVLINKRRNHDVPAPTNEHINASTVSYVCKRLKDQGLTIVQIGRILSMEPFTIIEPYQYPEKHTEESEGAYYRARLKRRLE